MTLVEFLRARLDEDEAVAFGGAPSPWKEGEWDGGFDGPREVLDRHGDVTARAYYGGTYGHVLRFDPARVLAEVEAKRDLIVEHVGRPHALSPTGMDCGTCLAYHSAFDDDIGMEDWPCRTVRLLALPYADHPDYREEWKP